MKSWIHSPLHRRRRTISDFCEFQRFNYNPAGTGEATEFVEITNISSSEEATTLDLFGVAFSGGPNEPFIIPDGTRLGPGEFLVIAKDRDALMQEHPELSGNQVIGNYLGSLRNSGERIRLDDPTGSTIVDFSFRDSSFWPQAADGAGASLTARDVARTPRDEFGKSYHWRSSTEFGGSPGKASAPFIDVVVNEVLTNTSGVQQDVIELFNPTDQAIDIGGWFLSDSADDFFKYEIPANTTIDSGGYATFTGIGIQRDGARSTSIRAKRNDWRRCLARGSER